MSNKNIKMLFIAPMLLGTLITISSNSWLMAWVGLEINLMGFIPLISNEISPSSSEVSMKYFLAQSLGSMLFISSAYAPLFSSSWTTPLTLMILLSLLIKMGAAPFHFWVPQITPLMSISQIMVLLSWQKIGPLVLTSFFPFALAITPLVLTNIIGAISGFNQTSLKKILAYSSISNNAWLVLLIILNFNLWALFFLIYTITLMTIAIPLSQLSSLSSLKFKDLPPSIKISTMINMFSLAGMPPLLGFIPKLMALMMIWHESITPLLPLYLIMSTLISLFFYLRLTNISLMSPTPSYNNNTQYSAPLMSIMLPMITLLGTLATTSLMMLL